MKKKIRISRISHKGEWRFGIWFDMDTVMADIARNIRGALWSNTNKCWHVAGDEETLKLILSAFRDKADIDISSIVKSEEMKRISHHSSPGTTQEKKVEKREIIPDGFRQPVTIRNVTGVSGVQKFKSGSQKFGPVRFSINESDGMLAIKFLGRYDKEWIREIRTYGKVIYDPERMEWFLRWSRLTVDSLADYFAEKGIKIEVNKVDVTEKVKEAREHQGVEIREQQLSMKVIEGLENVRRFLNEKRYSVHTCEAYISLLELFFKFHITKDPSEITTEDISGFFNDYIVFHNYSASYQNQMVSAIKMFYKLNGSGVLETVSFGRPRRIRALPKVFSKEDVKAILNSPRNEKHRLLLWMIYSCGLRRSEATNIKLNDLDRQRGILNIREAKGLVDRIVPVSEKVWVKIDEYMESYRPSLYLFEGQSGGRYSSESVYRVFKEALKRAGIRKEVGVHSLRHSYATHLHENGLDIRYIQELLGHRSTRTTEIYTHVSRRNLAAIRSPIEDLDIK
jgi:integrase/recombinase XerD